MKSFSRILHCALFVSGCSQAKLYEDAQPWTWLYKKSFSAQELSVDEQHNVLTFNKMNVPSFTQLVLSWNATRPSQGYFDFWAQAHNATKNEWGSWHKMMEWGADVQRSFLSASCFSSKYLHVRLEMNKEYADGFRIKVKAHEGANLTDLKAIFVCLSDFTKFKAEEPKQYQELLPSVMVQNVPKHSQFMLDHPRNNGLCSPTSCTMLVSYLTGEPINPIGFAEHSYDKGLNAYGAWPFNVAHAYECCKGALFFTMARLHGFNVLHQRLQQGIPVVVSVRGYLAGAPKIYEKGHLLVVVGWDAQRQSVICHDPAFSKDSEVLCEYPIKSFLEAWERSHRLAYIAEPVTKEES